MDNKENENNEVKLTGIWEDGYGFIQQKLMRSKINKYIKLILAYMLSFTGKGMNCFPSIDTMCKELDLGKNTIINALKEAEELELIKKIKKPSKVSRNRNSYILLFIKNDINKEKIEEKYKERHNKKFTDKTFTTQTFKKFTGQTCNTINNNKFFNSNNILSKDNIKESRDSLNKPSYKFNNTLNENIYKIIMLMKETENSPFKNMYIYKNKNSKSFTKNINSIVSYLWDIKKGLFNINNSSYIFDNKWIKKNNISFKRTLNEKDWNYVFRICKKAINKYIELYKKCYWPEDKSDLTNTLSHFFYNPHTKKSWFLYCLCNELKEVRKINTDKLSNNIFPDNEYGQKDKETAKIFFENKGKYWDPFTYWKKIKVLYFWYSDYSDALSLHNKGNWYNYCNDFSELLNRIKEFAETWNGKWSLGNFGIGNKTWRFFVSWMKKEKSIDIDPGDKLLSTIQEYKRNGRKVKNADKIRKEIEKK